MKYTPGPWEWVEDRFNGGYSGIVGKDGKEVLFPNHRNDGDDGDAWFEDFPNEADRNLMAMAPELLEALKAAKTEIELLKAFISDMGWDAGNNKRFEMTCEAIAKAEVK